MSTGSLCKKRRVYLVEEYVDLFEREVVGIFKDHGNAVRYLNTLNNVDSPDNMSFSSDLLTTLVEYKFMGYYSITETFIKDIEE